MNNGFSELQCEEDFENNIQVAQNSTADGPAAISFALNKNKGTPRLSWDERFKELLDFKKINGHMHVPKRSGSLGYWVSDQRRHNRFLKEGKRSRMTADKRDTLESVGFEFKLPTVWDQRFQELVDFKKINGHTYVPKRSGQLCNWVNYQRMQYHRSKKGKHSLFTSDRRDKLESVGFA
eukprot:scaffold68972_cov35-Attheya_sp.AAC.1